MKFRFTKLVTITQLVLAAMLLISCSGSTIYTSESLGDVILSPSVDKERKPVSATTVYNTNTQVIYCSFKPDKAPLDSRITAQWIYVKGEVADVTDYIIGQWTELKKNQGRMAMFINRPTSGWLRGNYTVVLSVNDREEIRVPFTIR